MFFLCTSGIEQFLLADGVFNKKMVLTVFKSESKTTLIKVRRRTLMAVRFQ